MILPDFRGFVSADSSLRFVSHTVKNQPAREMGQDFVSFPIFSSNELLLILYDSVKGSPPPGSIPSSPHTGSQRVVSV